MERCRTGISDCRERCTAMDLLRRMETNVETAEAVGIYCQTIKILANEAGCDYLPLVERTAKAVEGRANDRQKYLT